MTPEREKQIREYAASEEPPDMQRRDWLAATLRRDGRTAASDLLEEVDRLRRLPVIATCGECGHVGFGDYCTHPRFDGLEKHERPELSHDAEPPEWCPLRGAR